jgi:hypothetical protein
MTDKQETSPGGWHRKFSLWVGRLVATVVRMVRWFPAMPPCGPSVAAHVACRVDTTPGFIQRERASAGVSASVVVSMLPSRWNAQQARIPLSANGHPRLSAIVRKAAFDPLTRPLTSIHAENEATAAVHRSCGRMTVILGVQPPESRSIHAKVGRSFRSGFCSGRIAGVRFLGVVQLVVRSKPVA